MLASNEGVDNFRSCLPIYKGTGTIISILFIDDQFEFVNRSDVGKYIISCMEKL